MPLDPQAEVFLERLAARPGPSREQMTLEQTREFVRGLNRMGGDPPAVQWVEDRTIPGPGGELPVRVYADRPVNRLPVLVYLHGGRFVSGDLDSHDALCRQLAAKSGVMILAVDYRLAPEHPFPAAAKDAYAAVQWTVENAAKIGGDPERVGVGGDSAGGNLAAAAALMARDRGGPPPACQVLLYPMLDAVCGLPSHEEFATGFGPTSASMKRGWDQYLSSDADRRNPYACPILAERLENLAPAIVLSAECDCLRDEGEQYAARLKEAGVPVKAHRFEGAIHAFLQMAGELRIGAQGIDLVAGQLTEALSAGGCGGSAAPNQ